MNEVESYRLTGATTISVKPAKKAARKGCYN